MFKVFYYYYYLFYTRILPDSEPHATVVFTLGLTISLIVNGILNILLAYSFGFALSRWEMIGVFVISMVVIYITLNKSGKGKHIVEDLKPQVFSSNTFSIFITLTLFLIGIAFLFFQADIARSIILKKGG